MGTFQLSGALFGFLLILAGSAQAADFPSNPGLLLFSQAIADGFGKGDLHKVGFPEVRAIEHLVYQRAAIRIAVEKTGEWKEQTGRGHTVSVSKELSALTYQKGKDAVRLVERDGVFTLSRLHQEQTIESNVLPPEVQSSELLNFTRLKLEATLAISKNVSNYDLSFVLDTPPNAAAAAAGAAEATLEIRERTWGEDKLDQPRWKYFPVKVVSFAAVSGMYDLPNAVLSVPSESVTRSPVHNLKSTGDEFKGAGLTAVHAGKDLVRGLAHPRRGMLGDGLLELGAVPFRGVRGAIGAVKTGVSLVAYPLFRLAGGKPSLRSPLPGRRGAIVVVDSSVDFAQPLVDTYGEMIVRPLLKGLTDYVCVTSSANENDTSDCLKRLPPSVEYVDLFALSHSGGISRLDSLAREVVASGRRPELMISIGCDDSYSHLAAAEDTTGPKGTSWSVHFYLFSMLAKRLRGIPIQEAATQAYLEGVPLNFVNPVSIAGMIDVAMLDGEWKNGYTGSAPDFQTREELIRQAEIGAWTSVFASIHDGKVPTDADLRILGLTNQVLRYKRGWVARKHHAAIDRSLKAEPLLRAALALPTGESASALARFADAWRERLLAGR